MILAVDVRHFEKRSGRIYLWGTCSSFSTAPEMILQAHVVEGCGTAAEILSDLATIWDIPIIGCPAAGVGQSAASWEYTGEF